MKIRSLVFLSALAALLTVAVACGDGEEAITPTPTKIPTATPTPEAMVEKTPAVTEEMGDSTTIEVLNNENPYFFGPKEITLEAGKSYRFVNISPAEFHTFTVEDLGIDISIDGGTTVETDYTATHPTGTYVLVCLVHEAQGMVGTITIK